MTIAVVPHGDFNAASFRGITNGIVRKVGDHQPNGILHAEHGDIGAVMRERDAFGFGRHGELFDRSLRHGRQIEFAHGLVVGIRIKARDGQELLDKPRGACYALLKAGGVLCTRFRIFGTG